MDKDFLDFDKNNATRESLGKESPENESPENELPENESPENESPENELPENELPKNESPKNELPKNESLENELPKNELPKNESLENELPKNELPKNESLENELPKNELPKNESLENELPKNNKTKKMLPMIFVMSLIALSTSSYNLYTNTSASIRVKSKELTISMSDQKNSLLELAGRLSSLNMEMSKLSSSQELLRTSKESFSNFKKNESEILKLKKLFVQNNVLIDELKESNKANKKEKEIFLTKKNEIPDKYLFKLKIRLDKQMNKIKKLNENSIIIMQKQILQDKRINISVGIASEKSAEKKEIILAFKKHKIVSMDMLNGVYIPIVQDENGNSSLIHIGDFIGDAKLIKTFKNKIEVKLSNGRYGVFII